MTARPKWLIDTNVVSELMCLRPEPRVSAFSNQLPTTAPVLLPSPSGKCSTGSAGSIPAVADATTPN